MHDLLDRQDRFAEVEAKIRAAGEYVNASDDLRPRMLETARTERGEKRGKRRVRHAAMAAATFGLAISFGSSTSEGRPELEGADAVYQQAALKASCAGGFGWGLVQAVSELRERQSEKLRSE